MPFHEETQPDSIVDPRYIVNVLIELQVSIRKLSLYSLSHTLVPVLLEKLQIHFNLLFEFVEEITLGITRTEILYQGSNISPNNPVIRELAQKLNQLGLASMTFSKGLSVDEIFKFLKFLHEGAKALPENREQMVSQLHQQVQCMEVKLIRFGEALKNSQDTVKSEEYQKTVQHGNGIWRNLVATLMEQSPEEKRRISKDEFEEKGNTCDLAELINHLCQARGEKSKSYERTIVKYLNDGNDKSGLTPEERVHYNRELSTLLSRLEPEVRQQIFRFSIEEAEKEKGALEELLPFFSEPVLLEVFNQIHLSNRNISSPMLSLLEKFTELSAPNEKLKDLLASKSEQEQDLFRDLLTNKADRQFYPSSYRDFLDHELLQKQNCGVIFPGADLHAVEPEAVNYHLALITLELLNHPIESQSDYGTLVDLMNQLIKEGFGAETHKVLENALISILSKLESDDSECRHFIEDKIKIFINPETLALLLKGNRGDEKGRLSQIFTFLRNVAKFDLIRMLLNQLETEENMSTRKHLLQQIIQCGAAVIPLALERLKSPKWFVVRNMLVLLRDLKATEGLSEIQKCFMETSSPKVKLAALQVIEVVGKGTEFLYRGIAAALSDHDPAIVRYAANLSLSSQDPQVQNIFKTVLEGLGETKDQGKARIILQLAKKSGSRELIVILEKLRRRLWFRFWQGRQIRFLLKEVNATINAISGERDSHA